MKKIMLIAVAMLLVTPVIAATYSNPVGFIKDTLDGGGAWTMISVPMGLDDYALNDTDPLVTCAGEMISENLVGNSNSTLAPQIWKYSGGGWESAFLFGGIPGHPFDDKWVAAGLSTMTLDPGQSFYYLARTGFTWTVERPFTLN